MPATLDIQPSQQTPSRPVGKADEWDDALLLLLALISLSDTFAVAQLWDVLAPRAYSGLLLAESIDDVRQHDAPLPIFWWDVRTQRYGTAARGRIKEDAIFAALESVKAAAAERLARSTASLYVGGDVEIGEWQRNMAEILKTLALVGASLGRGGVGNLTADDFTAITEDLKFHFAKLERFAKQIEKGAVSSPEAAALRAQSYALSVLTIEHGAARVRSHSAAGFDEESNVLDRDADHCEPTPHSALPDCPSLTKRGWVKIGTLPPIGARICLWHCKCRIGFRRSAEAIAAEVKAA